MTRSLLLAALAVALALPAGAQDVRHRIVVTTVGATCQYRIADQVGQQAFRVAPGDQVRLQGLAGTKARFDFVPDEGIAPLARRSQTVDVQGNGETVTVRSVRGEDTDHEVVIQCCMEGQGNQCDRWLRATAAPADLGVRLAPLPGEPTAGPAAAPAPPPDPLLGPRMEVKE